MGVFGRGILGLICIELCCCSVGSSGGEGHQSGGHRRTQHRDGETKMDGLRDFDFGVLSSAILLEEKWALVWHGGGEKFTHSLKKWQLFVH